MDNTKLDIPCHCGSGETYIKCCWIDDLLREKRRSIMSSNEDLKQAMKNRIFDSPDGAQKFADAFLDRENRKPRAEFQGLSAEQVFRTQYFSLDSFPDIVAVNNTLSPEIFENIPIVRNSRIFLSKLAEVEPLKATAKGNLPVKFAEHLFQEIDDSNIKKWIKFRREEDSICVLSLRHVLKLGGWIKKEKNHFKLTRRGREVVRQGFSADHFFRLLQTFSQKFNWGFQDRYPDFWIIQGAYIFSLHLLHKRARKYIENVVFCQDFIRAFPEVVLEVDESYISPYESVAHCFSLRFLESFCEYFGFIEARWDKETGPFRGRFFVKASDFFDAYFIWPA